MRGIVLVAGVAVSALVVASCSAPPYEELRQRSTQAIPGTLSASLLPPGDVDPGLAPEEAIARSPLPDDAEPIVTLARVDDDLEGVRVGPAWVAVARGVCIREDKGELVSDARGNDPNDLECTPATFLLVALDASSGETLLTITGYDGSMTWSPDVAGDATT